MDIKFTQMLDNFITAVVVHDGNTNVIYSNQAALDFLGLSLDQIRGKSATDPRWQFIREDGSVMPLEEYPVYQVLTSRKKLNSLMVGVVRPDMEQPLWALCNAHPELDQNGNLTKIVVNFTDITKLKRAEEKLIVSQNFNKNLVNPMLDGFSLLDAKFIQSDVNPALCQMTGFFKDELLGKSPPFPYWPPEEYETIQKAFSETIHNEITNFELTFMRKNGERFPVIVAPSILKDQKGNIIGYIATVKDITVRKQIESKLYESELRYRTIVETAEEGVWTIDAESRTSFINRKMASLLGYSFEEFIGKSMFHFMDDEAKTLAEKNLERRKSGCKEQHEFRLKHKDGRDIWTLMATSPIMGREGKYVGALAMVTDITQKKHAEIELKNALKSAETSALIKSRFLDIAAHELRTPVTAFSLLLQLSQRKLESGVAIDLATMKRLRSQVDRISQLVIELLDVSRLEKGTLDLKSTPTDLLLLSTQCIDDFKLRSPNRPFHFSKNNEQIFVNMDPLRIYQVLSNLMDNAIKYTECDSPIEISVEREVNFVRVSVKDQGLGISKEQQAELFSPFTRGLADEIKQASGLGLGLFISREILSLHGGTIGVHSQMGKGSTFYFELPV